MISVIITCWKRFKRLEEILISWKKQNHVDEIFLWDNSGTFKTSIENIIVINSQVNLNPSIRYTIAAMAKNDIIINSDDDVMPLPGLTDDLLNLLKKSDDFIGISGYLFQSKNFHKSKQIHANEITEPTNVDAIFGCITMIYKQNLLGLDYNKFNKYQLELNLQGIRRNLNPIVVPTKNYEILEEMHDENALYKQPAAYKNYQKIYEKFFLPKML